MYEVGLAGHLASVYFGLPCLRSQPLMPSICQLQSVLEANLAAVEAIASVPMFLHASRAPLSRDYLGLTEVLLLPRIYHDLGLEALDS